MIVLLYGLENHIFDSNFYLIGDSVNTVGYCAIYDSKLLTQFYIRTKFLKYSQDIFRTMLKEFEIERIGVIKIIRFLYVVVGIIMNCQK